MTASSNDALRRIAAGVTYPGNQEYDPVTLAPRGVTKLRVAHMEKHLPELLNGGDSLLDIGSSKGFVSMWCRDAFKTVHGYEIGVHSHAIAQAVAQHHEADHVRFFNKAFRQIPIGKSTFLGTSHGPYDVVYAGSVHHHLFKDAVLHGAPPWLPFKKLAALTARYLILDGPFSIAGDTSLPRWAKEHHWSDEVIQSYSLENHLKWLSPQFALVRDPVPNERGRQTALFERVLPDMRHVEMTADDLKRIERTGVPLTANRARRDKSLIRLGAYRYKFDTGLQTDGVFMVLNSLPQWFARINYVITRDGKRVADMSSWVDGCPMTDTRQIADHWLRMNDMLACIGLVEIHLKLGDFILRNNNWIDIDVDMVNDVDDIAGAKDYLRKWEVAGSQRAFGSAIAEYIADNLSEEFVFQKAFKQFKRMMADSKGNWK